jgi:hypothetical protein
MVGETRRYCEFAPSLRPYLRMRGLSVIAFRQFTPISRAKVDEKRRINSDLPVLFRPQVHVLGGQLSYSDRHMVLPVETSGRLGMA